MNAAIFALSAILCGHIMASLCWLWYVLRENWRLTMRVAELKGRLYFLETRWQSAQVAGGLEERVGEIGYWGAAHSTNGLSHPRRDRAALGPL
jgi:hypothetical protein